MPRSGERDSKFRDGVTNSYEARLTAFIDILGFRELVKRTESAEAGALLSRIGKAFAEVGEWEKSYARAGYDRRISIFSDCILVSYPAPNGLIPIIVDVGLLSAQLLFCGTPARGAITVGPLFHHQSIVFGPALISAYDIERADALHPRIVVSQKVIPLFKPHHDPTRPAVEVLRLDADGLWFVPFLDYPWLTRCAGVGINDDFLPEARRTILEGLDWSRGNAPVFVKYAWLARYFNRALAGHPHPRPEAISLPALA